MCELCNSLVPLHSGGSPPDQSFRRAADATLALLRDRQNRILLIGYQFYVIYDISTPRKPEVSLKA